MSILITGGAGFIGSHSAKLFQEAGLKIVILDNLSNGSKSQAHWGTFVEGDAADGDLVRRIIRDCSVSTVVHLAANVHAGASVTRPSEYFQNNLGTTIALLDAMMAEKVTRFVFASSCAVYGDTVSAVVAEESPLIPVSPYGESKLAVERMLPYYARAYGLRWVTLRYFNVAGAVDGLCEDFRTSMRIIPRAVRGAGSMGTRLRVFGTAFSTKDGTAVRDYVHVADVAAANLRAVEYVESGNPSTVFNVGSGIGTSVLEIIEAASTLSGMPCAFDAAPRREGDPEYIVSDIKKARDLLSWIPDVSQLQQILSSVHLPCIKETTSAAMLEQSALCSSRPNDEGVDL